MSFFFLVNFFLALFRRLLRLLFCVLVLLFFFLFFFFSSFTLSLLVSPCFHLSQIHDGRRRNALAGCNSDFRRKIMVASH